MIKSVFAILGISVACATIQVTRFEDLDPRKKIVVIDTAISDGQVDAKYMCQNGTMSASIGFKSHFSSTDYALSGEKFHHGENIVGIIASKMDQTKYCVFHVAWFQPGRENDKGFEPKDYYLEALNFVKTLKNVAGINMSLAGPNDQKSYVDYEFQLVEYMTSRGVKVMVAAGNEHLELTKDNCFTYPACLQKKVSHPENFFVVTGYKPNRTTNQSEYLKMHYEEWNNQGNPPMSGSSQATAIFTGKLFSKGVP